MVLRILGAFLIHLLLHLAFVIVEVLSQALSLVLNKEKSSLTAAQGAELGTSLSLLGNA